MQRFKVKVNGQARDVLLKQRSGSALTLVIDDREFEVEVSKAAPTSKPASVPIGSKIQPPSNGQAGSIKAPMPGVVVSIGVNEGDQVKAGDTLVVVEAMKMENNITAPIAGTVEKVHVRVGQELDNQQLLISLVES